MNETPDVVQAHVGESLVSGLQHRLARQFKVQVADWQDTCRELAAWEDRYLVDGPSTERLKQHAALLDELERTGRWLAAAGNQPEFAGPETAEQVQLTLQDLRDSRAMWHGRVPEKRREEILQACFNES
jgi:hypothetical protein